MYQQQDSRAPGLGAQPLAPPMHFADAMWQWPPAVAGGGATAAAQAFVPPMRTRDGVAGLAIGLCVLAAALATGIGFTVRETKTVPAPAPAPAPAASVGETQTPAPAAAAPLAADGHAHTH